MTLDQARDHIGHGVVYQPPRLAGIPGDAEGGVITSVGDLYVFVRYGSDTHPRATAPEALTLLAGDPR